MMNLENKNLMTNIMMSQQKNICKVKYKLKDDFLAYKNTSENCQKWFDFFNDYNLNS